ncbi:MAG: ORF6N domain-containing protein [Opitutaceae bacterium]|jgi:hypothetical protein
MEKTEIVPLDRIQSRILIFRSNRVLLDEDLAIFYGTTTKALNQAVKRNQNRFPSDFCFRLTHDEVTNLKSQFVTSSGAHGGRRKLPSVFTEHGALMAATVLNIPRAVQMSLVVIRAFVELRRMVSDQKALAEKLIELDERVGAHDEQLAEIIEAIRQLAAAPGPEHDRKIGFHRGYR